jgi:alanine-synthesizing transaminase
MDQILLSDCCRLLDDDTDLTRLLKQKHASEVRIIDLTITNPVQAGINFPVHKIHAALGRHDSTTYMPDPMGLLSCRQAISKYYADRGENRDPDDILITSSTSEAYSYLFKLLCNPGDEVLYPLPGYPLIEVLASLEHISAVPYPIIFDNSWHINPAILPSLISTKTRAIIAVNPNNPTGSYLGPGDIKLLTEFAEEYNLPLIIDEVFNDYSFQAHKSGLNLPGHIVFTLNGFSKVLALPGLKLSWVHISGPQNLKEQVKNGLSFVSDAFLSANTPVQEATDDLLKLRPEIQAVIMHRLAANMESLQGLSLQNDGIMMLPIQGGWQAILKPQTQASSEALSSEALSSKALSSEALSSEALSSEALCYKLLDQHSVYTYPAQLFGLDTNWIIISLLPETDNFQEGIERIREFIKSEPKPNR